MQPDGFEDSAIILNYLKMIAKKLFENDFVREYLFRDNDVMIE